MSLNPFPGNSNFRGIVLSRLTSGYFGDSNLACFSSGGLVRPKNFLLQIVLVQCLSSNGTKSENKVFQCKAMWPIWVRIHKAFLFISYGKAK
jgi:hypothetical protein